MNLAHLIALLFAFIGALTGCTVAVALRGLMLRFWPVLLATIPVIALFRWLLKRAGIRIASRTEPL